MGQCDGGRIDPQQLTPKTEDTTVWGAVGARAVCVAGLCARACGVPSTVSVLFRPLFSSVAVGVSRRRQAHTPNK